MEQRKGARIMIAAAGSGSGKTTITCALLQALKNRGKQPLSFKSGPDYIDPMFHTEILGIPSRNLDLFFMEPNMVRYLLDKHGTQGDLAVIEGVMGYYDGLAGTSVTASSYDLARETATPVLLVVDCKGMSVSVAAVIKGFLSFREDHFIAGVVLNRMSPVLYEDSKKLIEAELRVPVLGYLPVLKGCSLESRHLGLVTAKEVSNLKEMMSRLADQAEETLDLDGIVALAEAAPLLSFSSPFPLVRSANEQDIQTEGRTDEQEHRTEYGAVRVAVAMDRAFCFYYQDNLDLLVELGAEIVPFSPLSDENLPEDIHGLLLGGGYPELYLDQLAKNQGLRHEIKEAIADGLPCLAECGGFMYLQQWIKDEEGRPYPMVGAVEGECYPTKKLGRFGYVILKAYGENLLGEVGTEIKGHEFHYWDSTNRGNDYHAEKPLRKTTWDCIVTRGNLWAGYPHVHFYSNPQTAISFIQRMRGYASSNGLESGKGKSVRRKAKG